MPVKKKNSSKTIFSGPIYVIGAIVVAVIVFVILDATHTIKLSSSPAKNIIPSTTNTSTTKSPSTPTNTSQTSTNTSSSSNTSGSGSQDTSTKSTNPSSTSTGTSTAGPITPYGTFVSNHNPPENGNSETSVCITSPGATCGITFTNGSQTESLANQQTDSSGTTSWNWSASILGTGHWVVTVTATLNGKTATATDSMDVGQ